MITTKPASSSSSSSEIPDRPVPTITYHRVNVFTHRPFGGNPLAVFPDAEGLPTDVMQSLAREINL